MLRSKTVTLLSGYTATGSTSSAYLDTDLYASVSIQFATSGATAPNGVLKLQCSNDIPDSPNPRSGWAPTSWADVTTPEGSPVARFVNATGPMNLHTRAPFSGRWLRASWTAIGGGTGTTFTLIAQANG